MSKRSRLGCAVFLTLGAIVLSVVATILPMWGTTKFGPKLGIELDVTYGVYDICYDISGITDDTKHKCQSIEDAPLGSDDDSKDSFVTETQAAAWFAVLAVLCSGLGLVVAIWRLSCSPSGGCSALLTNISGFAGTLSAGLSCVMANAAMERLNTLYTGPNIPGVGDVHLATFSPGPSFFLMCCVTVLLFTSAALSCCTRRTGGTRRGQAAAPFYESMA
jgi:hypothetical protein